MNAYKIMIVDDEPDILELLEKSLAIEGFHHIIKIDNGLSAVSSCKELQPDMIILDIMLPGLDGYEVCKQIRQFSHSPILFLSSKNDELDKLLGLAIGGDDYVTKPFSPKEVVFRVKAQLRRMAYQQPPKAQSIRIGTLRVDPEGCQVTKDGKDIALTAREFEILQYMAKNIGRECLVSFLTLPPVFILSYAVDYTEFSAVSSLVEIYYRGRVNLPLVTSQKSGHKGSRAAVRRSSCP